MDTLRREREQGDVTEAECPSFVSDSSREFIRIYRDTPSLFNGIIDCPGCYSHAPVWDAFTSLT
jgi:hypothetical protein